MKVINNIAVLTKISGMFFSRLSNKILLGISLIVCTPVVIAGQTGIKEITEDTLTTGKFYQKHFLVSNSEEFADGFFYNNDLQYLDLGAYGQFSGLSYRGTDYKNSIPVLNGIPLESATYGSWNLLDIPYYVIDNVDLEEIPEQNFPGIYKPVFIQSRKTKSAVPFSRIGYRFGDYNWNHTDVTLSRYLRKDLSVFASGSKDDFPDRIGDNDFHGSRVWVDLDYRFRQWKIGWLTYVSDNNVRVNSDLPDSNAFISDITKETQRSSNFRFFNLKIKNDSLRYSPKLDLYHWYLKEQTNDDLLIGNEFKSGEEVWGIQAAGDVPEIKDNIDIQYRVNFLRSNTRGSFWRDKAYYKSRMSFTLDHRINDKFGLSFSPEITMMTDRDLSFYSRLVIGYSHSDRFLSNFIYRRSGRYPSIAETSNYNRFFLTMDQFDLDNEVIDNFEMNFKYIFNDGFIQLNPYLADYRSSINNFGAIRRPSYMDFSTGRAAGSLNYGFNVDFKRFFNRYFNFRFNYNFMNSDINNINAVNAFSCQLNFKYLEDYITDKDIDTELNISGRYITARDAMKYLPLYRLFAYSGTESPAIAMLKIHSCAHIRDLSIFHEMDIQSDEEYSYVLGHKRGQYVVVRIGVTWNFYN
ncbi:hypothetical protein ACFL6G_04060 [candidate division KSB1 bacterium]